MLEYLGLFLYMLAKRHRLTTDRDIRRLFRKGKRSFGDGINLIVLANGLPDTRFGFVVSNKVDKRAVIRNQIKRRLREIIRLRINSVKPGYDAALVVDKRVLAMGMEDMTAIVVRLLDKAKISQK
jgi:ribonuclease P protein component